MYVIGILLPLISGLINLIGGRKIGRRGGMLIGNIGIWMSAIIGYIIFYEVGINSCPTYIELSNWFELGWLEIDYGLRFDSVSTIMIVLVSTVSGVVHWYSTIYMGEDPHINRFMGYISLFTFFMYVLICSQNIVQIIIGWEGVGVSSYLLINFWYTRIEANKSAIKAIIVNRIGDMGLILGIIGIIWLFKTSDLDEIFALAPLYENYYIKFGPYLEVKCITLLSLFLLLGVIGKSAQIGLHTWLPDAMEGPTPVSALIHAATMVTAGVFLLIRISPFLEYANFTLVVISILGGLTAFIGASIGLVQNDLKKVIAYSTCSQLGYMVFACGLSQYSISLFHLFNHGFYKGLLFLCAGSIIHGLLDQQDIRKFGGIIKYLPFTYILILIGSLSLMGWPFLSGFFSKDALLQVSFAYSSLSSSFVFWLACFAGSFTAFYSIRSLYLSFVSSPLYSPYITPHESSSSLLISLSLLAFGAIFSGFFFKDIFIGPGSNYFSSVLTLPSHSFIVEAEFIPIYFKLFPFVLTLVAIYLVFFLKHLYLSSSLSLVRSFKSIYLLLLNKWHFDLIYNHFINYPLIRLSHSFLYKIVDKGFIEIIGPLGISRVSRFISVSFSRYHSGHLYKYLFSILIWLTLIISFWFISPLHLEILFLFFFFLLFRQLNK